MISIKLWNLKTVYAKLKVDLLTRKNQHVWQALGETWSESNAHNQVYGNKRVGSAAWGRILDDWALMQRTNSVIKYWHSYNWLKLPVIFIKKCESSHIISFRNRTRDFTLFYFNKSLSGSLPLHCFETILSKDGLDTLLAGFLMMSSLHTNTIY